MLYISAQTTHRFLMFICIEGGKRVFGGGGGEEKRFDSEESIGRGERMMGKWGVTLDEVVSW